MYNDGLEKARKESEEERRQQAIRWRVESYERFLKTLTLEALLSMDYNELVPKMHHLRGKH